MNVTTPVLLQSSYMNTLLVICNMIVSIVIK